MNHKDKLLRLKEIIKEKAVVIRENAHWVLDLRNVTTKSEPLDLIADIFWDIYEKEYPFQVGGQEISGIPILSAILLRGQEMGKPVNGFITRKSRKTDNLQRIIEGEVTNDKIILVDDSINIGRTFERQCKLLENAGREADSIFVLVRFRDPKHYKFVPTDRFKSLFSIEDVGLKLSNDIPELKKAFRIAWKFQSPNPDFSNVVAKSSPIIDEDKIYFGSDDGYFWALNQSDGSVAWKFKVARGKDGKSIYSTPALYEDMVYFGAYDGNLYALNKDDGALIWKFNEAEYISSSPAIAEDLHSIFIGLEYGIFNRRGGIASLDLKTGKKIWDYKMPDFVPSSPVYSKERKLVAVGCNDHCAYLFDAKKGSLKWKFETKGEVKGSFAFDLKHNNLLFGSFDGTLYAVDLDTGEEKGKFTTKDIIWSKPIIDGDYVIVTSLDKHLYKINLDTGTTIWDFAATGRIFSAPLLAEDSIYFGGTDGRFYELSSDGKLTDVILFTERVTGRAAYNPKTKRFFVPTCVNELYCLYKTE